MKCPSCGFTENKVIDSRLASSGEVTRRRRECDRCGRRFTTYERVEENLPVVVKRDGRREAYDRLKLMQGLRRACEKRPISTAALDAVVDVIERDLQELGEGEVPTSAIGEQVMVRLRELDQVAYVRFASVYRRFDDISAFVEELQRLTQRSFTGGTASSSTTSAGSVSSMRAALATGAPSSASSIPAASPSPPEASDDDARGVTGPDASNGDRHER